MIFLKLKHKTHKYDQTKKRTDIPQRHSVPPLLCALCSSRLRFLSYIYAIDICAYAIMDNHYHTVLHANQDQAKKWTMHETVKRWMQLYCGHILVHRWLKEPETIDKPTLEKVTEIIEKWRERLCKT